MKYSIHFFKRFRQRLGERPKLPDASAPTVKETHLFMFA